MAYFQIPTHDSKTRLTLTKDQSLSSESLAKPYTAYLKDKIHRSLEWKDFFTNKKEFKHVFQQYMSQGLLEKEEQ